MISEKAKRNQAALQAQARINASANTDEQALAVPSLYPEWDSYKDGATLETGIRLNHMDVLYKVLQKHQKQADWTPDKAPSLYAPVLVSENPDKVLDWVQPDSTNGYMTGDRVKHVEKTWESLVDNNVWEPGAVGTEALWVEVTE